ncbi:MAG: glycosyltransferase family 9 protein, partial [Bryobacteraceae bacterium]|nr:glycosyltransferase family 9 protein [Bryobacteraceae bacterium]
VAAGGSNVLHTFPLPEGRLEGDLPEGDFILASPVAGWAAKQWPAANYAKLAQLIRQELGLPLVLNGSPASGAAWSAVPFTHTSLTGLAGLSYATRRATAGVGVDSGPMHLAAALGKPGVAVMGPTDPSRNGPYGDSFTVLRSPQAQTSYKRHAETAASMRDISPEQVLDALKARLACRAHPTGLSHN